MAKIKVHPLFLALLLVLIIVGKWYIFLSTILAVIIHEYAHFLVAKWKGYRLISLTFLPYGAVLSSSEYIHSDDETLIAVAGPLSNIFMAIIVIALWWLLPSTYGYTLDFFRANMSIAFFNMLPAYPLDGSRIILSLSKNRKRAMSILKILGIVLSFGLMALFIASAIFSEINYTLGIASVFIFAGSIIGDKKESYIHLCNQMSYLKDFSRPLERNHIVITENTPIKRILKCLKPYTLATVEVIDNAMNTICIIEENELEKIFLTMSGTTTISQALSALRTPCAKAPKP